MKPKSRRIIGRLTTHIVSFGRVSKKKLEIVHEPAGMTAQITCLHIRNPRGSSFNPGSPFQSVTEGLFTSISLEEAETRELRPSSIGGASILMKFDANIRDARKVQQGIGAERFRQRHFAIQGGFLVCIFLRGCCRRAHYLRELSQDSLNLSQGWRRAVPLGVQKRQMSSK